MKTIHAALPPDRHIHRHHRHHPRKSPIKKTVYHPKIPKSKNPKIVYHPKLHTIVYYHLTTTNRILFYKTNFWLGQFLTIQKIKSIHSQWYVSLSLSLTLSTVKMLSFYLSLIHTHLTLYHSFYVL